MFHNRTINNKINRLHERALKIVYKDETDDNLSFQDLDKDRALKIHDRNVQRIAVEMYKVKNNISPLSMQIVSQLCLSCRVSLNNYLLFYLLRIYVLFLL